MLLETAAERAGAVRELAEKLGTRRKIEEALAVLGQLDSEDSSDPACRDAAEAISEEVEALTGEALVRLNPPASREGLQIRFRLPHVTEYFTGRGPEIEKLRSALAEGRTAVVAQAITGLGGIGKTQLAARLVHSQLEEFDVVAWIRAESGAISDLADLANRLGLDVDGVPPAKCAELAVHWFTTCSERWLLIFDNATSADSLKSLVPSSGNGGVVITTRNRELDEFGPVLSVDVFDDDLGAQYLTARSGRSTDIEAAKRLSRVLGGLPLALAHAGAFCRSGVSFDEYRALLEELPAAEMFNERPDAFYESTVASTWQVSIAAAQDRAPLAEKSC